jgi:hypothetical protein
MLAADERESLFRELEAMPSFLAESFAGVSGEAVTRRGAGGTFSPVEQCWHLADLEAEGYAIRIRRLLSEETPRLADFDGGRMAEEREYRARSLREGLVAFQVARRASLAVLRSIPEAAWARAGLQEGVGNITLADVPRMMREHDASHRAEVAAWLLESR